MILDSVLDGWWIIEPDTPARQLHAGDEYDLITSRGPFRSREEAERYRWRDHLLSYFEHDIAVYARHCPGCGKWAKTLAFDDGFPFPWAVTECKDCGMLDTRKDLP